MKEMRHRIAIVAVVVLGAAIVAGTAGAGSGGSLRIEPGWYDGHQVSFLQPSLFSAKPNGGVLGCFGLGPDLAGISRPTQPLYIIFDQTATQDHCDGDATAFRHDHVLSVAPGDPGYTGAWTLVLLVEATPGSIDLAAQPFTRAQQVRAAIEAGTLVDVTSLFSPDAPPTMVAPWNAGPGSGFLLSAWRKSGRLAARQPQRRFGDTRAPGSKILRGTRQGGTHWYRG